jgi:hypothetical protein
MTIDGPKLILIAGALISNIRCEQVLNQFSLKAHTGSVTAFHLNACDD